MIRARAAVIGPKACESAEASRTRRADLRRTPDSLSRCAPIQRSRPRDSEGVPSAGAGSVAASDDLGESTKRLVAELGDARQSIIDLQGANAAYVRANGKLRDELRAENLLRQGLHTLAGKASDYFEALEIAHGHLDMAALRVSHPKDAALISAALQHECNCAKPCASKADPWPGVRCRERAPDTRDAG